MGDASDNVPGVPSIGEKTAVKIIKQYHCIEKAIEFADEVKPKKASENLKEFKDMAILSKELVTIDVNVPIEVDFEKAKLQDLLTKAAYELFKRLEFKSLLTKFKPQEENLQLTLDLGNTSHYTSIKDAPLSQKYIDTLVTKAQVAYIIFVQQNNLIGISISYEENTATYLEVGPKLNETELIFQLKPFFESNSNKKIAHGLKDNIAFLRSCGVELSGVELDTTIAGYLLNPTRDTYHYDDLATEFLNETYTSEEELLGKGKSKKQLSELTESQRTDFMGRYADIVRRASFVMKQKLIDNDQKQLYYNIEHPLIEVLAGMEKYGFKVNRQELIDYGQALTKKIDILTAEIYTMAGEEFNINSPKQLGVILFEKLGLKADKKNKTGYSTAAEVLEKLAYDNPIVRKILEYRTFNKLKTTYADGLLSVMDEKTDKIYSTFNQTITATGRISSTEPNLQNIPIKLDLGRELRKVFVPESDEFVLLDADYSQIELRVLAHMSGDEILINAFCENQDIHKLTASQVFKIPFDEVTAKQRSNAKAVNFGIVYGIGAFSLSQDLGITRKEAERYIEGYFEKYPKVKVYLEKLVEDAKATGYAQTLFNRRRVIPEINSKNFVQRSFGERVAMNMPIQGTAADIIKIAMVKVHQRLKEEKLESRLILQVHDELIIETKKTELEKVKVILKDEMEQAVSFSVPIEVDMHEGNTWFEAK
jgi:DNA polymerase-1